MIEKTTKELVEESLKVGEFIKKINKRYQEKIECCYNCKNVYLDQDDNMSCKIIHKEMFKTPSSSYCGEDYDTVYPVNVCDLFKKQRKLH